MNFNTGDIFYISLKNEYYIYKVLAIDTAFATLHILAYKPLAELPNLENIAALNIYMYHAPFDVDAFTDAVFLQNSPIKSNELIGYHAYLQQTQAADFYVPIANNYYKNGYKLTTQKKYEEAIDEYSKAIDLFPPFFEAIDNRAFCKMDTGFFAEAIEDFKLSLVQNPNSMLAEFSIGECYFKMGDYELAKPHFEKAHEIDPNHKAPSAFLAKVNDILNASK